MAHFHAFFVVLLVSLLAAPVVLVFLGYQNPGACNHIHVFLAAVISGSVLFLFSLFLGWVGALRRVLTVAAAAAAPSVSVS